jgi:hypothetical protein
LADFISSIEGQLTVEALPVSPEKILTLRLRTRGGTARFAISLNSRPPAFTHQILSGSFNSGLLARVGKLLLAASVKKQSLLAAAKGLSDIKNNLPGILKITESWPYSIRTRP